MSLRKLLSLCLIAAASLTAYARIELPVTQVNGRACYCYTVEKKQTLYFRSALELLKLIDSTIDTGSGWEQPEEGGLA